MRHFFFLVVSEMFLWKLFYALASLSSLNIHGSLFRSRYLSVDGEIKLNFVIFIFIDVSS